MKSKYNTVKAETSLKGKVFTDYTLEFESKTALVSSENDDGTRKMEVIESTERDGGEINSTVLFENTDNKTARDGMFFLARCCHLDDILGKTFSGSWSEFMLTILGSRFVSYDLSASEALRIVVFIKHWAKAFDPSSHAIAGCEALESHINEVKKKSEEKKPEIQENL